MSDVKILMQFLMLQKYVQGLLYKVCSYIKSIVHI